MKRNGFEKNLVVLLFVLVLVIFSFAERDTKKLERYYAASALIKKGATALAGITAKPSPEPVSSN